MRLTRDRCTPPTDEQVRLARKMRAAGESWKAIEKATGTREGAIRRRIDPDYLERRVRQVQIWRERRKAPREHRAAPVVMHMVSGAMIKIPQHVLAEREARQAVWPTLNQALLGDPMPGRSALDKRREDAPQPR